MRQTKDNRRAGRSLDASIDTLRHAVVQLEGYRFMVSSSDDVMWFLDRDGVFRVANQAFLQKWNLDEGEVIGKHYLELFSGSTGKELEPHIRRTTEGERVRFEQTEAIDGLEQRRLVSMHPCYDEADTFIGTSVIDQNITDLKEKQDKLKAANQQLREALEELKNKERQIVHQERLSALGEMASGVAHDFNNALQPILLAAGMLIEDEELMRDPEAGREYVGGILQSARDAADTVRRLVRFYKPSEQSSMMLIDLSTLVKDTVSLTKPKWREESQSRGVTVTIMTDLEEDLRVEGFHDELRELVVNLLFNAVESMDESGTIELHTRREGEHIILEAKDSGAGMTEDQVKRCLEPFFTTKIQRGHGLGLSIVHSIVKRHSGEIDIQSEPGKGSMFRIAFPAPMNVILEDEEGAQETKKTAEKAKTIDARILLVDDEKPLLDMLGKTLERRGATVYGAESGHTALKLAAQNDIDLLITDQAMPGMPGNEVAQRLREDRPDLPVIMLTGFGDFMKKDGRLPEGIDLILGKPVSISELLQAVDSLMVSKS